MKDFVHCYLKFAPTLCAVPEIHSHTSPYINRGAGRVFSCPFR